MMDGWGPEVKPLEPQAETHADLPGALPGKGGGFAVRCCACGTRLRAGQPHTATSPWPHQTYAMLGAE